MYSPTPEDIAEAFDLGQSLSELVLVRRGDTETWRLDTVKGSYLVKGYQASTGGQFTPGGLPDQLAAAMAFERRALAAGVDMAEPVAPVDPLVGWVARTNDRLFRVYRWIDHRAVSPDDDLANWLGRTMLQIHQLEPLPQVGLPDWWRGPIWPRATWEEWVDEAQDRRRPWSELARERLPYILELSARIEELCEVAQDSVTTHGDFKTHNMLMTPDGPVLVDWDSVRVDSAALEAGRVAYIFGAGLFEPMRRILTAYTSAGGRISWAGPDLFFSVTRHDLQVLFERIRVSLGRDPAAWWMGDSRAVEESIEKLLRELPDRVEQLRSMASELAGR
jgi:aminoglycoside phosphotransferase (APT) family kinase protein